MKNDMGMLNHEWIAIRSQLLFITIQTTSRFLPYFIFHCVAYKSEQLI